MVFIYSLQLQNNNLKGSISPEIGNLTKLEILNLQNNQEEEDSMGMLLLLLLQMSQVRVMNLLMK